MEDEVFTLSPRGIASIAMLRAGLASSSEDPRIDGFWELFESMMRKHGYVSENEEESDG